MTTALVKRPTTALVKAPRRWKQRVMVMKTVYAAGHKFARGLDWHCENCDMHRDDYYRWGRPLCREPEFSPLIKALFDHLFEFPAEEESS